MDTDLRNKLTNTITITTRGSTSKDAKTVTLHTAMLATKSPYLYVRAQNSTTGNLKLLDLDSDAFSVFAGWVYSNTVSFDTPEDAGDILASVLECYQLANDLDSPAFGNAVLTQACNTSAQHGLVFRNDVINDIYSRTPFNSKLRAWIVDEWIWQYDSEGIADLEFQDCMSLFGGFVFEVMKAQARRIGKKAKKHQSPSQKVEKYHSRASDLD